MFHLNNYDYGKESCSFSSESGKWLWIIPIFGSIFENGISYKVFAVSDTKEIKTNSGINLTVDDVIANLKGHEDEFDALVFSCGDAVPVFQQNADKPYNVDLMQVIKTFGDKGKMMIGHCASAMMFDFTGITKGKK